MGSEMPKLLPCPFCGSDENNISAKNIYYCGRVEYDGSNPIEIHASRRCLNCGATGSTFGVGNDLLLTRDLWEGIYEVAEDEEIMINEAWNNRSEKNEEDK